MTELTPTQIEGRLKSALATIRDLWDTMLDASPSITQGQRTHGQGATLDDEAEEDSDTDRTTRLMDARTQVTATLNSWCRVVIEDHNVHHGIPEGTNVPGMAELLSRWAYLMSEHEAALDLLEEITRARRVVESYAPPTQHPPHDWYPRRPTMRLGSCPLTWQDPETAQDRACEGVLRGDDEGWVSCDKCGTRAVMGWWEKQIHGEGGLPGMTIEGVCGYLHRTRSMRITRRGVQAWVDAGDLVASGTTPGGASTYDPGAVEAALTRRDRRRTPA